MAVDLRCPDCRAKLRLPTAPDPGDDVECPECGSVFPAPDPDADDAPRKKKSAGDKPRRRPDEDDEDDDRPRKKAAKKAGGKKPLPPGEQAPRRKKAKKKKVSPVLLAAIAVGGLVFLGVVGYLLYWFFGKKPVEFEMISYLPADANSAAGLNVGHFRKYPEYYTKTESVFQGARFKKAADALAKAAGLDVKDLLEFGVQGSGPSGGAVVIRTVKEFDAAGLAKLPGAKEYAGGGQKYYAIDPIDGLGYNAPRVFAPTPRLVVFCPGDLPEATFKGMLGGNRDAPDKTLLGRSGDLAKRAVKGTFWWVELYEGANTRPTAPAEGGEQGSYKKLTADAVATARGFGFKASVGARSVRFEAIVLCRDADAAGQLLEKFKASPLSKGNDEEPPREWKNFASTLGDKKVQTELLSAIGGKQSGELFILSSEVDTTLMMTAGGSVASKIAGAGGTGGPPAPAAPQGGAAPKAP